MTPEQIKHLLLAAKHEIFNLRNHNAILSAKVEVLDIFKAALMGRPQEGGMGIDIIWELERAVEELKDPKEIKPQ